MLRVRWTGLILALVPNLPNVVIVESGNDVPTNVPNKYKQSR